MGLAYKTYRLQCPSGAGWTSKSTLSERLVGQSILSLANRYAGFESIWTSTISPYEKSQISIRGHRPFGLHTVVVMDSFKSTNMFCPNGHI